MHLVTHRCIVVSTGGLSDFGMERDSMWDIQVHRTGSVLCVMNHEVVILGRSYAHDQEINCSIKERMQCMEEGNFRMDMMLQSIVTYKVLHWMTIMKTIVDVEFCE